MKLIIKESQNMVVPSEVKANLGKLNLEKIPTTKTNYNLLLDINYAATNSNQIVTILSSDGNTVGLSFLTNTKEAVTDFTKKLKEKNYVSGESGNKFYIWTQSYYKVTNKEESQTNNNSTTTATSTKTSSSSKNDDVSKEANDLLNSILRPMIPGESVESKKIMENITNIKRLMI